MTLRLFIASPSGRSELLGCAVKPLSKPPSGGVQKASNPDRKPMINNLFSPEMAGSDVFCSLTAGRAEGGRLHHSQRYDHNAKPGPLC
jgi:hypothetical protein